MKKSQDRGVSNHQTNSKQAKKINPPEGRASSPRHINPRAFLQSRRPERFSDSTFAEERELDRSLLEHHLATLTKRGQELDFERFARRLAERTICPNLLPQTGPRGGGDSKVDSETYPVAEDLALAWYVGKNTRAAHERWAFAFSAAEEWKPKAKADIEKLASTGRGYVKAFFVTNQFVPDRRRAEFEDQLRETCELDVRLLDLNWILESVFSGKHVDLVESELGLRVQARQVIQKGPRDTERERDLEEANNRINTAIQNGQFTSALVDDALSAAELARGLERPRGEIDGLFARADRLALKYGTRRQLVEVAYQEAWTAFWWYEDEAAIPNFYIKVEERAKESRNSFDFERLVSLWHILEGFIDRGPNALEPYWLEERTKKLKDELERLAGEQTRPSTALHAEMFLLQIQLRERQAAKEPLGPVLKDLQETIERASSLTGFPLDSIIQTIVALGKYLDTEPEYEDLFETAIRVSSDQEKDLNTARLLVLRGQQHLEAERPREAIKVLGRSLRLLFSHAGRYEAVQALYLSGVAYEQVGLLWAARGVLVAAASLATDEFWRYGNITQFQSACYRRLKWIELQIGRLPQILEWHATDVTAALGLIERGDTPAKLTEFEEAFDALLGILLLRTDFIDLRGLKQLPDELEQLNLIHASRALIYALGHTDIVAERFGYDKSKCDEHFVALSHQPAADDLPRSPSLWNQQNVILSSRVFGCEYKVNAQNVSPCVEIAESILAALEALLASTLVTRAFAHLPELPIKVKISDFAERPFSFEITEVAGRPHVEVRTRPFNPHQLTPDEQLALRSAIEDIVIQLMAHSVRFNDHEATFAQLGEEEALSRAINFTSSFVAVGNVLGHNPTHNLADWEYGKEYPILRTEPWSSELAEKYQPTTQTIFGSGKSSSSVFNPQKVKHSKMYTASLIRGGLWDKAEWSGMLFFHIQDGNEPPILAPVFKDVKAGRKIFEEFLNELGRFDKTNKLRVVIVRGIDRDRPHAYRVLIGTNLDDTHSEGDFHYTAAIYRIHDMNPSDSLNLDRFVDDFRRHQKYFLAPGFCDAGNSSPVDLHVHLVKQNIEFRNAWEIGLNDPDAVAIGPDDLPLIPANVENPPVNELLAHRQSSDSGL